MPPKCPIANCTKVPETGHLMCKRHWFQVPQIIRKRVWKTYDHGAGLFTEEYKKARDDAINAVNNKESFDAEADAD